MRAQHAVAGDGDAAVVGQAAGVGVAALAVADGDDRVAGEGGEPGELRAVGVEPRRARVVGGAVQRRQVAAERGLGPRELADLGKQYGVPAWQAAGRFYRTYEEVTLLRAAAGSANPLASAPPLDAAELVAAVLDAFVADPDGYRIELIDGGGFTTPQDKPLP